MKRAWLLLSVVPILTGLLPFLGWLTGIPMLVQFDTNYLYLDFLPALCFILAGIALIFSMHPTDVTERVQLVIGCCLIFFAMLTLGQDLLGVSFHIDEIFARFNWKNAYSIIHPGRMPPNTAIAFLLCGVTFVMLPFQSKRWVALTMEILIFILFLISILAVSGYILDMEFLYSWNSYKSMLQASAIAFVVISAGLAGIWCNSPWSNVLYRGREDTRIVLLSSAILLCMALAVTLANFYSLFQQQNSAIGNSFQQMQKSRAMFFQNEIFHTIQEMDILRKNTLLQGKSDQGSTQERFVVWDNQKIELEADSYFEAILKLFSSEGFTAVAIYDGDKNKLASMGRFIQKADFSIKEKINYVFINIIWKNGWYLQIASQINPQDKKVGLLVVEAPLPNLDKVFASNQVMGKTGDMLVCMPQDPTQTNASCYSSRLNSYKTRPEKVDGKNMPVHFALAGESGLSTVYNDHYQRTLVAYGPIQTLSLGILVEMELSEIYQPIIRSVYSMVPVIALAIFIGLLLLRLQVLPLIRRVINAEKSLLATNKRLQESEERYAVAVRGSSTGLWDWDIIHNKVFYSPYFKGMLGYTDIEFPNDMESFKKSLHPDDYDRVFDLVQQHVTSQTPYDIEYRLKRKSGDYHWFHAVGQALWDDEGNATRMAGSLTDITERKRAEQKLAVQYAITRILSEAQNLEEVASKLLQALCERLEWEFGSLWMVDNRANLIRCAGVWQQPFMDTTALTKVVANSVCPMGVDMPGRVWETAQQLWVFDVASEKNFRYAEQVSATGLRSAFCFPILLQNKVLGVIEFFTRERQTPDESLLKMMAAITTQMGQFVQRKQAENNLRENENYKTAVLEFASDSILTVDQQGNILSYNPRTTEIFNYPDSGLKNKNINILIPGLAKKLNDVAGKSATEFAALRGNGETFSAELTFSKMYLKKQEVYICIIRDITGRKKIEKLKNEFVSVVSHELRTPLTSIRGALGLMLGGSVGEFSVKGKKLLEVANSNCDRLLLLINDILDIEKIEAGKMDFEFSNVNINKIINEAIEANKMYAEKFGVTVHLERAEEDVMVYVDPTRLMQVLSNLISNAVKFSPPKGKVELTVMQRKKVVRVAVTDYGIGVAETFRANMFQKFSQADSSSARDVGGTGLGLSICKAIIEKFGGTINFTSKPNEKTVFYFDLPKADVALQIIEDKIINSRFNEGNKKILICEDDREQAQYVQALLQSENYQADIAYNVVEARKFLMENEYQALLLDLLLPDKDGIAFMRELREQEKTRELPVIVMSIVAQIGRSLLNGNAFSVLDWLDKPVDFSKLLASVERLKKSTAKEMPRILHVEDNADTRDVIATLLQEHARIHGVATLQEAHEELQKNKFDLVILDLILPDGNGVEILPLLAEYQLPVIVFSSVELDDEYAHYVNQALIKSELSNDDLLNTIKKIIHTSHKGGVA